MGLKHVGRIKNNKRKIVVAYRTVPGESENCIIVTTENLMADEHDSLMTLLESDTGQQANEFAEAMARTQLPDGRNMLAGFHSTGKMMKVAGDSIEMTPDRTTVISLTDLNSMIASQRGVSVDDLAVTSTDTPQATNKTQNTVNTVGEVADVPNDMTVLTDEELADKYRKDATTLYREARTLREKAEQLSPSKKRKKASAKSKTDKRDSGPVEHDSE